MEWAIKCLIWRVMPCCYCDGCYHWFNSIINDDDDDCWVGGLIYHSMHFVSLFVNGSYLGIEFDLFINLVLERTVLSLLTRKHNLIKNFPHNLHCFLKMPGIMHITIILFPQEIKDTSWIKSSNLSYLYIYIYIYECCPHLSLKINITMIRIRPV